MDVVFLGPLALLLLLSAGGAAWVAREKQERRKLSFLHQRLLDLGWAHRGTVWSTPAGLLRIDFRKRADPRADISIEVPTAGQISVQISFGEPYWDILGDPALAAGLGTGALRKVVDSETQLDASEGKLSLYNVRSELAVSASVALCDLAERLRTAPKDLSALKLQLLQQVAEQDSDPSARAGAVSRLLELMPELASRLAKDPAPSVRFAVAHTMCGDLGFELARDILSRDLLASSVQSSVIRWFVETYPPSRTAPALADALPRVHASVVDTLVTALGELGNPSVIEALKAELPTAPLSTAARIAEALVRLDRQGAENELLHLAERLPKRPQLIEEEDLLIAIADGLAQVGTRRCILPLRKLSQAVELTSAPGLSLKVALDVVLSRLGEGPGRGSLSQVGGTEGSLSNVASSGPSDRVP